MEQGQTPRTAEDMVRDKTIAKQATDVGQLMHRSTVLQAQVEVLQEADRGRVEEIDKQKGQIQDLQNQIAQLTNERDNYKAILDSQEAEQPEQGPSDGNIDGNIDGQ